MSIRKITPSITDTLSNKFKQQKYIDRINKKTAEENNLSNWVKSVAKEMMPLKKQPTLTVSNTDTYTPSTAIIDGYSGKLAITDSIWAPWSYIAKNKK